jgi:hypothetical protein
LGTRQIEVADISASYISAAEAVDHAIVELSAMLAKARFTVGQGVTKVYLELRRDLPYRIHETSLVGVQILVNRNYKPLGNSSKTAEDWVNYEEATNMHVQLSAAQIHSLVSPGRESGLFGDGNPPWHGRKEASAYLERLKKLRALL